MTQDDVRASDVGMPYCFKYWTLAFFSIAYLGICGKVASINKCTEIITLLDPEPVTTL